jgi:predicted nucleotidyltransferase
MPTTEDQYQQLVQIAKEDKGVVAFILAGGRGKGMTTEHSDYDITIIVHDELVEVARVKYQAYTTLGLDITIMGKQALMIYGVWGSDTAWARYGFAHIKAVFDLSGTVQHWLDEQELIPAPALDDAIKQSLDGYLNYTHRSLKNFRDLRKPAAHMAACDAVPLLISFLFAAEGRVRPYNEYLEWELSKHPLANLAMTPAVFTQKTGAILASGDEAVQKEFLALVRTIAAKTRSGQEVLKSWEGYYFG